jgi:hypothetical protein
VKHLKTYRQFLNEAIQTRPGKPYHGQKIAVFDLDDTIVVSKAKIKVFDPNTGESFELTPEEFNEYEKAPGHQLDFSQFRDLEIMKAGKLIDYYLKILKDAYRSKVAVGIVTARDDREMIFRWLREHLGLRIDKDLVFAVNDPVHGYRGNIADKKKQAFEEIIGMGYRDIQFYDDDKANINLVKSLELEHPGVEIMAVRANKRYSIAESVSPPDGIYREEWLFDQMQKGKKDIQFLVLKHPGIDTSEEQGILKKARELGYGEIKVDKGDGEAVVIHRNSPGAKKKAKRLVQIANGHGGYLADRTAEEAREIGELLDYAKEDIDRYVKRNYGK